MKVHVGLTVVIALLVSQILGFDVAFAESYSFDQFRASSALKGKTRLPEFNGRDKKYKNYRTRIRNGLNEGPNFAGHYSVVQIGCGTGCSFAFIADNQTGQVFDFPRGGEDNMYMQLLFKSDSRLIAAMGKLRL